MTDADEVIRLLRLEPHPEGGYFSEVYRAELRVTSAEHSGARSAGTAIYFLLRAGEFSALHRVRSDELWHHYQGDPIELHTLDASGRSLVRLGPNLGLGERPLALVRAGTFQAARVAGGERGYALCGCTVSPGFEFSDFEMPGRSALERAFPEHAPWIVALTR